MKVAVFGDVHGNLIALEQFLKFVSNRVDGYVCTGDIVNYGPWSEECVQLVKELPNLICVKGNHEDLFENDDQSLYNELVQEFTITSRQFFSEYVWISSLPYELDFDCYRVAHTLEDRYIYRDTKVHLDRDTIIGHSHQQFIRFFSSKSLLNPGSVGQNREFIDLSQFLVLDLDTRTIEPITLQYNVDLVIQEMKAKKYSSRCIEYYSSKRRLR